MAAKSHSATSARKTDPSAGRTGLAVDASSGKLMNVGFIGLGHMGTGMGSESAQGGLSRDRF